ELHAACPDDRGQIAPRFFELFVYYNIIELACMRDFLARVPQPSLDSFLAVLAATAQPALELGQNRGRRKDEDAHRVEEGFAPLLGALPVDFQHDVEIAGARLLYPALRGAVAVAVHLGGFEEISALEHGVEGLAVDEVVLAAVRFAFARSPRRI